MPKAFLLYGSTDSDFYSENRTVIGVILASTREDAVEIAARVVQSRSNGCKIYPLKRVADFKTRVNSRTWYYLLEAVEILA